jgi:lipopolysaccharide transport system permease protein
MEGSQRQFIGGETNNASHVAAVATPFEYSKKIWNARYFWFHLTLSDIRARWRRSFFGVFWSILQPLGMSVLLANVLGRLFKIDVVEYLPYILSGIIVWEFVVSSTVSGSLAFVQADSYIKEVRQPLAIYTLRTTLTSLFIVCLASTTLVLWIALTKPGNFGLAWLSLPGAFAFLLLIAWPLSTTLAYFAARFRDIPPALTLILQALWFLSPVFFQAEFFRAGGMAALVDYNPIYHLLELFRAPMLHNRMPAADNYLFCAATVALLTLVAVLVGRKLERKVIFYL